MSNLTKSTSGFIVGAIIFVIIISFAISGYQGSQGGMNSVGSVGDFPISIEEYQRSYDSMIRNFRYLSPNKELTRQEIEKYKIKEQALERIVNRKLLLILGERFNIRPSTEELKAYIMKLPYFQEDNAFSASKYRQLLAANNMSIQKFEDDMREQIVSERVQEVLKDVQVSTPLVEKMVELKKQKKKVWAAKIEKESLRMSMPISNSQIKEYLGKEENQKKIKTLFDANKSSLNKPEEVLASHILLKTDKDNASAVLKRIQKIKEEVTAKNFKTLAKKYTEEPAGKKKGGSLGWFSRGRMVPAFENVAFTQKPGTVSKPVKTSFGYHIIYVEDKKAAQEAKLEDHREDLAKELIQKSDNEGLDKYYQETQEKVAKLLKSQNKKQIESLKKELNFAVVYDIEVDRFAERISYLDVTEAQLSKLFQSKENFHSFDNADSHLLVSVTEHEIKSKEEETKIETERTAQANNISYKAQDSILKNLREKTKVVTRQGLL